ncbi:MAG TPA: 50S ribosomal protein L25/general stress protein Ctc [Hyphomicrobiales bacterium]|nr:50S ribosomal protein L25/general stress protein Ctc [Hyphomicrobiales bacterium]
MTATKVLEAEARDRVGKGAARALRREGKIPAVIYGDRQAPAGVALDRNQMTLLVRGGGFMTTLFELKVGDRPAERVIPRDFQLDPVRETLMHVDFLRLGKDAVIDVEVPVHFVGQDRSPGIKRGGVLNIVRHRVELHVRADAIPEFIEIDVSELDINDSVHISAAKLPEGARPVIHERDFTIATVAAPTVMAAEEEAKPAEEGAEGAAAPAEESKAE